MTVGAAFGRILADGRLRYNQRFEDARRAYPNLEPQAVYTAMEALLDPLVQAVGSEYPWKLTVVVDGLYDLLLELLGRDLVGPHALNPWLAAGWRELLPGLVRFLAVEPRRLAGSITNALYNLSCQAGAQPRRWIDELSRIAVSCPDLLALLQAGQVLSWLCGMAQYRQGALAVCRSLPPDLVRLLLRLDHHDAGVIPLEPALLRFEADPWWQPALGLAPHTAALKIEPVSRLGAFRGFGGLFLAPPTVTAVDDHFTIQDVDSCYALFADAFGQALLRTPCLEEKPARPATPFTIDRAGRVTCGDLAADFPELANATSWAANRSTLAVTTSLSHTITLIRCV